MFFRFSWEVVSLQVVLQWSYNEVLLYNVSTLPHSSLSDHIIFSLYYNVHSQVTPSEQQNRRTLSFIQKKCRKCYMSILYKDANSAVIPCKSPLATLAILQTLRMQSFHHNKSITCQILRYQFAILTHTIPVKPACQHRHRTSVNHFHFLLHYHSQLATIYNCNYALESCH